MPVILNPDSTDANPEFPAGVSTSTAIEGVKSEVADLAALVGSPDDAATADTVFGKIAEVQETVSA